MWATFEAGYGTTDDAPAAIKAGILLIVADLYENRENTIVSDVRVTQIPIAADRLLSPYRRVGI